MLIELHYNVNLTLVEIMYVVRNVLPLATNLFLTMQTMNLYDLYFVKFLVIGACKILSPRSLRCVRMMYLQFSLYHTVVFYIRGGNFSHIIR